MSKQEVKNISIAFMANCAASILIGLEYTIGKGFYVVGVVLSLFLGAVLLGRVKGLFHVKSFGKRYKLDYNMKLEDFMVFIIVLIFILSFDLTFGAVLDETVKINIMSYINL